VAALASGYSLGDPADFAGRIAALMGSDAVAVPPPSEQPSEQPSEPSGKPSGKPASKPASKPPGPVDAEVVDAKAEPPPPGDKDGQSGDGSGGKGKSKGAATVKTVGLSDI
jgi:hypothetical protein